MDHKAGKAYRLRRRKDIDGVFSSGRCARDALLTIMAAPNGRAQARCGVGVSRRHGGAVCRNRVKRLCREAFRLSREQVPGGWDYMILPRVSRRLNLQNIQRSIVALTRRLAAGGEDGEAAK